MGNDEIKLALEQNVKDLISQESNKISQKLNFFRILLGILIFIGVAALIGFGCLFLKSDLVAIHHPAIIIFWLLSVTTISIVALIIAYLIFKLQKEEE